MGNLTGSFTMWWIRLRAGGEGVGMSETRGWLSRGLGTLGESRAGTRAGGLGYGLGPKAILCVACEQRSRAAPQNRAHKHSVAAVLRLGCGCRSTRAHL